MTIFRFCFRYIYRSLSSSLLYLFVFSLYSLCSYSFYLSFLSIPLLLISLYPSLLFPSIFISFYLSLSSSLSFPLFLFISLSLPIFLFFLFLFMSLFYLCIFTYFFLSFFFSKGTHFRRVRMRLNQTWNRKSERVGDLTLVFEHGVLMWGLIDSLHIQQKARSN